MMFSLVKFSILLFCFCNTGCIICSWVPDLTIGQAWPLPRYINYQNSVVYINPYKFNFKISRESCDILEEAVKRYANVINGITTRSGECIPGNVSLTDLEVQLISPCEVWPYLYMEEHYDLHVNNHKGLITSSSVWGILRGLETFSQLITPSPSSACLVINNTDILDYPTYSHRGLLLDTSRHYLPVELIFNILSSMEMNKMNVFHWHIVDDQSFPYQSYKFPSLSEMGAYDAKRLIYSQQNVKDIIEYGRLRGIRVVPEFDSPGHTLSWGKGVNKLLTPCYTNKTLNGKFGPIDPSRSQNYKFMRGLLKEVKTVFPDKYIHIGGDEVDYTCWQSNPAINKFMEDNNITKYSALEGYYIKEVLDIVNNISGRAIVWQEVFLHNATLRDDTIVHVWLGNRSELLNEVTRQGKLVLLSEGWYLDHINKQWEDYYKVDPADFNGTTKQIQLVLGGEACMWGEMVDESNIVARVWPRASAVAERLWSSRTIKDANAAAARLNEHVCRMKRRGVAAQPANGPGYCPY